MEALLGALKIVIVVMIRFGRHKLALCRLRFSSLVDPNHSSCSDVGFEI